MNILILISDTCGFETVGGFIKQTCRTYKSGVLSSTFYICHNSSGRYKMLKTGLIGAQGEIIPSYHFDHKCDNDDTSYQACGLELYGTDSFQSYDNAVCQLRVFVSESEVFAELVEQGDNENDAQGGSDKTVVLPSGVTTKRAFLCNDKCELGNCEDEARCNGFTYGQYCRLGGTGSMVYIEPKGLCTRAHEMNCCEYVRWEWNDVFIPKPYGPGYQCNATEICFPENPNYMDLCNKKFDWREDSGALMLRPTDNYISNVSRCSPIPVCENYVDQTNCSDRSRVGLTCRIAGFISTVSKYRVCGEFPLCDDKIDSVCKQVSSACRVHKHLLCDGNLDCSDGSDERISICLTKTEKTCVRRGDNEKLNRTLPLAWLTDGVVDCMDGEDEKDIWPVCGFGETRRYVTDNGTCSIVFICRTGEPGFIELSKLCDGVDTCGNENLVCRESKSSKTVSKKVASYSQGLLKRLSYCLPGVENLLKLAHSCSLEYFIFPDDVYGLIKPQIILPNAITNCDDMFGEQYLYSSCTGRCTNSPCPLTEIPLYNSCPEYFPNRVGTLADNKYLTFAVEAKGVYTNDIFVCKNGNKCIRYSQVCDLVDDCGDESDENLCTNHFKCNSSGHYIPKTSKCDGKFDCLDLSDECNEECSKEILDGSVLKISSWIIGISAVLANLIIIAYSIFSLKKCRTTVALTNKTLVILISIGDLLVGSYLLTVSVFDAAVAHGKDYCTIQTMWLASGQCSIFGVTSTIGSQLSLFAMTLLSLIRAHGIWSSMRVPGEVTVKSFLKIIGLNFIILASAVAVAVPPILEKFKDFFINGMRYDIDLKLFIGSVSKETHFRVFEEYFGRLKNNTLSWDLTDEMVDEMFSHDQGIKDFAQNHTKIGFYGNDGVCLFKYFIRGSDPQQIFVWSVLIVNFTCFVVISVSYIIIGTISAKSSRNVSSRENDLARQRMRRMNQRISLIITTDFLCWVPFIIICMLHYLELVDATPWYSLFSMVILPINSVINPLLYSAVIWRNAQKVLSRSNTRVSLFASSVRSRISIRMSSFQSGEGRAAGDNIEMQEI